MNKTLASIIATALLLNLSFITAAWGGADEDGCWEAPNHCISASARWSEYSKGKLISEFKNICDQRLYLRFCNERKNGSEDCGSSGLNPGATKKWGTYKANGEYSWRHIGSLNFSKDWVCAGKVRGWND